MNHQRFADWEAAGAGYRQPLGWERMSEDAAALSLKSKIMHLLHFMEV